MNCRRAQLEMGLYAELASRRRDAIDSHVDVCGSCAEAWRDELAVRAYMRDLPVVEPTKGLETALLAVPRTAPTMSGRHEGLPAGGADRHVSSKLMTFEQWLRTFAVILALGLITAGVWGDADDDARRQGAAPQLVAPAAPTVVVRSRPAVSAPASPPILGAWDPGGITVRPRTEAPSDALAPSPSYPTAAESPVVAHSPRSEGRPMASESRSTAPSQDEVARAPGTHDYRAPVAAPRGGGGGDQTNDPEPAAPPQPPEATPSGPTPKPPATPRPRVCVAVPVVVWADVGGSPDGQCQGCDGFLTQADLDAAVSRGLVLPTFQLALYDSDQPPMAIEKTVISSHINGPIHRDVLELCGVAPFTATILAISDGWSSCSNIAAGSHVISGLKAVDLPFPLVDTCRPAVPTPSGPTALAQPDPGHDDTTPEPPAGTNGP